MEILDYLKTLAFGQVILLLMFSSGVIFLFASLLAPITIKGSSVTPTPIAKVFLFLVGIILMAPSGYSAITAVKFDGGKRAVGQVCKNNEDCKTKNCYPEPNAVAGRFKFKYCISDSLQCALPGFDGAEEGTAIFLEGDELICRKPKTGPNQFFRREAG